jgi:hypothetical protein
VERAVIPRDRNAISIVIYEPHALALQDIDGDGLRDIVTGERFWGHPPAGDWDITTLGLV